MVGLAHARGLVGHFPFFLVDFRSRFGLLRVICSGSFVSPCLFDLQVETKMPDRVTDAGRTYWVKTNEFPKKILGEVSTSLTRIGEPFIEIDIEL